MSPPSPDQLDTAGRRRVLLIGIGVAVSQQLSGINSVMYYGTLLLEQAEIAAGAPLQDPAAFVQRMNRALLGG